MAINILLGTTGDGKTYTAVKDYVIKYVESGRKVKTNIPLNIDYFKEKYPEKNIDELIELKSGESGNAYDAFKTVSDFEDDWINEKNQKCLIIVDEAHFCLSSDRPSREIKPIEDFFALHRQMGYDILLLTQTTQKMSRRTIGLVKHFYHCSKLSAVGQDGRYALRLKQDGNKKSASIQEEFRKYDPAIFPYYKSHALSDGSVTEGNDGNVKSLFKRWPMLALFIGMPIFYAGLIYFDLFNFNPFSSTNNMSDKVAEPLPVNNSSNALNNNGAVAVEQNNVITRLEKMNEKLTERNNELIEKIEKLKEHPFEDIEIYLSGSVYSPDLSQYKYLITAKGPHGDFKLTSNEMLQIGYELNFKSACLLEYKFKDFKGYAVCGGSKSTGTTRMTDNIM